MSEKVLPLRPNVAIIILNAENQIFIGERLNNPGIWQLPQGGRESESREDLFQDALREANEETGADIDLFTPWKILEATNSYDFPQTPTYAAGRWRGQFQNFIVLKFNGKDSDFNLERYHPEFQNWRWCSIKDLQEVLEAKRVKGYLSAFTELELILANTEK